MENEEKDFSTMNIYALPGHIVKVTERTKTAGYDSDSKQVAEKLEIEKEYRVKHTTVNNFSTSVVLEGFPDITFNSVSFVDCVHQYEEADMKHPAFRVYN